MVNLRIGIFCRELITYKKEKMKTAKHYKLMNYWREKLEITKKQCLKWQIASPQRVQLWEHYLLKMKINNMPVTAKTIVFELCQKYGPVTHNRTNQKHGTVTTNGTNQKNEEIRPNEKWIPRGLYRNGLNFLNREKKWIPRGMPQDVGFMPEWTHLQAIQKEEKYSHWVKLTNQNRKRPKIPENFCYNLTTQILYKKGEESYF